MALVYKISDKAKALSGKGHNNYTDNGGATVAVRQVKMFPFKIMRIKMEKAKGQIPKDELLSR